MNSPLMKYNSDLVFKLSHIENSKDITWAIMKSEINPTILSKQVQSANIEILDNVLEVNFLETIEGYVGRCLLNLKDAKWDIDFSLGMAQDNPLTYNIKNASLSSFNFDVSHSSGDVVKYYTKFNFDDIGIHE